MASVVVKQSRYPGVVKTGLFGGVLPRKSTTLIMLALILSGLLGMAVYQRASLVDFLNRASSMLGQSASAAGNLPLAKSLVALLDQRSPGERTAGELASNKKRLAAKPQQRALGKVRPALPAPFVKALTTPIADVVEQAIPIAGLDSPLLASVLPGPVLISTPGGIGGGGPGGGGGGPGGGGGGPPPPSVEVPPVVTSVPEPGTWLTFILGFYLLACALRRQRLAKASGAALTA